MYKRALRRRGLVALASLGLISSPLALGLTASPVAANVAGSALVVREVYGAGGNSGAAYNADFVELYNPTAGPLSLAGLKVQYRSASGVVGGTQALAGTLAAGTPYLIQMSAAGSTGAALPTPDLVASPAINMAAGGGQVILGTASTYGSGDLAAASGVTDMVGASGATSFETSAATSAASATMSLNRAAAGTDTDKNGSDFSLAAPSPVASGGAATPPPSSCPTAPQSIAQIQGDATDTSPCVGSAVTTTGVVTASYPTGGLAGFDIQTGGAPSTPTASDGIFVYAGTHLTADQYPVVGTTVDVSGTVAEFNGLTEINVAAASGVAASATSQPAVVPLTVVPGTDCAQGSCDTAAAVSAAREQHESELFQPTGDYTVTDPYDGSPSPSTSSHNYGEIGLAAEMSTPLVAPTEDYDAQDQTAQIAARTIYNTDHEINVDDASGTDFTSSVNTGTAMPWFGPGHDVRVGAAVTFAKPVVLSYGNKEWRLEPQAQVVGDATDAVSFSQTRSAYASGPADVGGNLKLATFNVLNYFPTTGVDYVASGGSCTYYTDRAGNKITVNDCGATGPRGAADAANLQRQQDKIVHAINNLGADVVSLEEVENSVQFGKDRDVGLSTLVTALNADAGAGTWAFAPSPAAADLPPTAEQDVIRTAFIYRPASVSLVGASKVLTGSAAFANAREPLAQAFKPRGSADSQAFGVIVNHFKSKGSGTDDGTGQGNANPDRVAQANALLSFADDFKTARGISKMFLVGDFNAYSHEDPVQAIEAGGYTAVNDSVGSIDKSYSFSGQNGSLDHVFANAAALGTVTGADVWAINAFESVYYEYSRYNYNVTDLYDTTPFRASDHNPEIVGINTTGSATDPVTLNLLNINDFHGRIDAGITTKWATTIEQLRDSGGSNNTLLLSAGDNIGASLFASASAHDNPTIDVLNALDLNGSAVGNHEFDQGYADLTGHVEDRANWDYLGANVYHADGTPALQQYATYQVDGLTVGVIGAVTKETPSLVSPAGIEGLTFGDPVDAVNRVADQLTDGDPSNGEADVLLAEYHEGAPNGDVEKATLASNLAASPVFTKIVDGTSPKVAAIFTGHTHKRYAYSAPVPGTGATRPVIQTGNYGDFVGQVTLTVDPTTHAVLAHTEQNVAKAAAQDLSYPRVAQVKQITDQALADAATLGNQKVGTITADVTTAFTGGTYTNGKYTGGTRDDRASESTLGDLVANVLRDEVTVFNPGADQPDLGVVNPGGLRAELNYLGDTSSNSQNTDGVVTYAEANSVLPFSNNVYLVKLTGAQLKAVLEQQDQTNADGTVPSRAYLQLGVSDNVRVTTDRTQAAGSRITSVYIDDAPLDPAKTYTVSTFSFLAAGGDNFRAFTQGTSSDTGLLDADLFRDYFTKHPGIAPDFARQQVTESGKPDHLVAGTASTFTLSNLDLTSQGSPQNTMLVATIGDTTVGTYPVTDGSATVAITVPTSYTTAGEVTFTATPSGTTVTEPFTPATVTPSPSTVTATASPATVTAHEGTTRISVAVTSPGGTPTGQVQVRYRGKVLGTTTLAGGRGSVRVGPFTSVGTTDLTVLYLGDDVTRASSDTVAVHVVKQRPTVRISAPSKVTKGAEPKVQVTVTAPGGLVTGSVRITYRGTASTKRLSGGKVTFTLKALNATGKVRLKVTYTGDASHTTASGTQTIKVVKK